MSKNIIIQKNGVEQSLTGAGKISTPTSGGGSCYWVPEDEVQLASKTINANGTYEAEDEGFYGYSDVTVKGVVHPEEIQLGYKSVEANGSYEAKADGYYGYSSVYVNVKDGDLTVEGEDEDGNKYTVKMTQCGEVEQILDENGIDVTDTIKDTVINGLDDYGNDWTIPIDDSGIATPIDSTPDSSTGIIGTDEDDGNEYLVEKDENGYFFKTPVPSYIEMYTLPNKTEYENGETIIKTGLQVQAFNADGTPWRITDGSHYSYRDSIIPAILLDISPTIAHSQGGGGQSYYKITSDNIFGLPEFGFNYAGSGTWFTWPSQYRYSFTDLYAFKNGENNAVGASKTNSNVTEMSYTYDGKTVHYTNRGYTKLEPEVDLPSNILISSQLPADKAAWLMVYGDPVHVGGDTQEITVTWKRFGDGKPLTTTFEIEVTGGNS